MIRYEVDIQMADGLQQRDPTQGASELLSIRIEKRTRWNACVWECVAAGRADAMHYARADVCRCGMSRGDESRRPARMLHEGERREP